MQEAVRKSLKKDLLKGMTGSPLQEFVDSIMAIVEKIDWFRIRPMSDEVIKELSRQRIKKQYLALDDLLKLFAELIIYRAGYFKYPDAEMQTLVSKEMSQLITFIKADNREF